mmetsp:Transcript_16350/g.19615  ORF Transcript_16350/g.19615 Transcript_16350/m.19615 type:complete len:158 (+) Transcript_16350:3-476(+)
MAEEKVVLRSSDEEMFEVDQEVAKQSTMIRNMIEDAGIDCPVPLSNVTSKILAMVVEYCSYHVNASKIDDSKKTPKEDIDAWDTEFVKVDKATLFELILAASDLNIKNLLDLTCFTLSDKFIKGKTPEEIRTTFNIKTEVTPEEEEELKRENQWAFE